MNIELRQNIETEAHRLGFELFGVTAPDPPPHIGVYTDWIGAGRHGEMGYLGTERALQRRGDPTQILPECRSILVLGVSYPAAERPDPPQSPHPEAGWGEVRRGVRGRLASYAWGADYHAVLAPRLKSLVAFIEKEVGAPLLNRWYTDTGPVLERDLAQRAGLGWIGKNTCLIHPRLGSYFLLAEIFLDLELQPDPPFEADRCGACTRCLVACPTGCILPDRTLDARRCISYLTIELKGAIPLELRPHMGEWVFGCDICQQVCPWNSHFARPNPADPPDEAFAPRPGVPAPLLVEELALTPQDFKRKFKDSPVRRAKRSGYLRNVAVALGNSGHPVAVSALSQALSNDLEPLVRGHAAWALGRIGGAQARRALEFVAAREMDGYVQGEVGEALARLEVED